MRIREIDSYSNFITLEDIWKDALRRCDHNVFSTWEWLSIWWKHFGMGKRLTLLLAEDDDKVFGIAPIMYCIHKMFGLRIGKIEFLGTPNSNYSNFILTERSEECIKLFMNYLLNNLSQKWDCIELKEIPETAEFLKYLSRISGNVKLIQMRVHHECPYVPLPKSFDTFFKGLGSNFRRDRRRRLRQLQEKHTVEFKDYSNTESFKEGMMTLFYLHQKRWKTKGQHSSFDNPKINDFHLDVARSFSERGWLSLHSLLVDSKAVASSYGFRYRSKLHGYQSGMDPTYRKYSVGDLLSLHLLENCINEGLTEFDFSWGKDPYKYRWNPLTRKNLDVILIRRGILSWIRDWLSRKYWYQGKRLKYLLKMR